MASGTQIIPTIDPTAQESDGIAGPQISLDGQNASQRLGNQGEIITGSMNGYFFEQTLRGNMYCWVTALAGVAMVATTTGALANPTLWNPAGSGRLIVLQKITFGRTAVGTPLEGSIVYNTARVNDGPGTGCDLVAGTAVAGTNLRLGMGDSSKAIWIPTGANFTAAPTLLGASGIAQTADNGATTVSGPHSDNVIDYINGLIVIPPGRAFVIGAAVSLSTTYTVSVWGLSIPAPVLA